MPGETSGVESRSTAANLKGRSILWWAIGSFVWLLSIPFSLILGHDLVSAPPPSLQFWATVAEWLPLVPVITAAAYASVTLLRRGTRLAAWVNAAKGLMWCSLVILVIALPKAP